MQYLILGLFPKQAIQYHSKSSLYDPITNSEDPEIEQFYEDLQDLLEITPKIYVLFITGNWKVKVRSQEIPGITGKLGLGTQNEEGKG